MGWDVHGGYNPVATDLHLKTLLLDVLWSIPKHDIFKCASMADITIDACWSRLSCTQLASSNTKHFQKTSLLIYITVVFERRNTYFIISAHKLGTLYV